MSIADRPPPNAADAFIEGPAGRLQWRVDTPPQTARALAVVCHPHTLYGGTLNNKVVHQLARTFVELGALTVRFNFRGAGESEGEYDEGVGETRDLERVVDTARSNWPGLPLWLAGFSFGAYVALRAARVLNPAWLVTVAPPVNLYRLVEPDLAATRWLLIQGTDDEIVPASAVMSWVNSLADGSEVVEIPNAGHFFHGRLNPLRDALRTHAPASD